MHGFDREHVQPAKRVVNVDDRSDGDEDATIPSCGSAMHAQHNVQVFVLVPEKRFLKGILEEGEDADAISRSVSRCRLGGGDCRQAAKVLQTDQRARAIAQAHARIDPLRRSLNGSEEQVQRR